MEARKEMERAMRVERGGDAEFELVRKKKKRAMLSPV
jgi:hypothetical protein